MPMWWDAYLGDTQHLTTIEHGAYLLLIGAMWRSGGSLPLDDKLIARTAKLTPAQWQRMQPTIMAFMTVVSGRRFTQAKLLETMEAVKRRRQSQTSNARAKWLKKKGRPDAMASSWHSHGMLTIKEEDPLLVQSTTQAQKGSGSAEKKAEVAAMEEALAPSTALLGTRLMRKKA
jgi:uncharacterized protein YdaU (DUF1376 family)